MCVCVYLSKCAVCLYVRLYVLHVCACVYARVCMCACLYVCVRVCVQGSNNNVVTILLKVPEGLFVHVFIFQLLFMVCLFWHVFHNINSSSYYSCFLLHTYNKNRTKVALLCATFVMCTLCVHVHVSVRACMCMHVHVSAIVCMCVSKFAYTY